MASNTTSLEPLAIGIDIGGTGTKFGIVDRIGNVLFSSEMSTRKHAEVDSFIDELHSLLSELIAKAGGIGRMKGIGVGAPNGNFIPVLLNMPLIFPGKVLFHWPNS